MLCPRKLSNSYLAKAVKETGNTLWYNCEEGKCAWWSETRKNYYNTSQGKQDIEIKGGCALKIIAEDK